MGRKRRGGGAGGGARASPPISLPPSEVEVESDTRLPDPTLSLVSRADPRDKGALSDSCEVYTVYEIVEDPENPDDDRDESKSEDSSSPSAAAAAAEAATAAAAAAVVRRSTRLRSMAQKERERPHGKGRVKVNSSSSLAREAVVKNAENHVSPPQVSPQLPPDSESKPVKVKSRWRRSSELESPVTPPAAHTCSPKRTSIDGVDAALNSLTVECDSNLDADIQKRLNQFQIIGENVYHCDKAVSKEAKKMICDCFLTKEEIERGDMGCGEDCLNRLLMIECNSRCPVGERCTNRRFQSNHYSKLQVIKTEKKGLGIQAVNDIAAGDFLMEYVGEVLNWEQFNQRAQEYSSDNNTHHYFMSLKGDAVIDATLRGNISRFINHSCDPNAETQKWTVNGILRIGFFSKCNIKAGDEITFDYQFQRYGKEGLRCYCEASNCRGWIGEEPDSSEEEDEEEVEETSSNSIDETLISVEETDTAKSEILPKESENKIKLEIALKTETVTEPEKVVEVKPVIVQNVKRARRTRRKKSNSRSFNDLIQDMDLEEEMNNLNRTGVKNQSHTLSLCRAMVRAKHANERLVLLKLLAFADLPCRRLFLDYRGLRLLAPWCENADSSTRLKILTTLEKLPIPNKTILKESKIIYSVENWQTEAKSNINASDESAPGTPTLIDEKTGLPSENVNIKLKIEESSNASNDKKREKVIYNSDAQREKILKSSTDLLENWSTLQEIFKIPKKERIEIMKEHERQANEQPKNEKEPIMLNNNIDKERSSRHDRDKKRPPNLDIQPRRSQVRLDDRVLTPVPAMSKEERRREFAARMAHQEQIRRVQSSSRMPNVKWMIDNQKNYAQINDYSGREYMQPTEYMQIDYQQVYSTGSYQMPYAQQIFPVPPINTAVPPPIQNYSYSANCYNVNSYQNYIPPVPAPSPYANSPLPQNILPITAQTNQQVHSIPTVISLQSNSMDSNASMSFNPQPIPSLVPSVVTTQLQYPADDTQSDYYSLKTETIEQQSFKNDNSAVPNITSVERKSDVNEVVRWPLVKLPSKWRSMKDPRGRTYYYHVKHRISQWIPPLYSPTLNSKDEDSSDDESEVAKNEAEESEKEYPSVTEMLIEGVNGFCQVTKEDKTKKNGVIKGVQNKIIKKARPRLVTERIISPRQEEDIIASKLDLKRYKETKEKLRRRKELALTASGVPDALNKYKKRHKSGKHKRDQEKKSMVNEKAAKRIKDIFTAHMARVMVHHLDLYRREDCQIGRITNTADFKHLAKKLTHFVMLKELKHCQTVNELECNDSVKQKAKEFVKKYMAKYGPVYQRPPDEMDY